MPRSAVVLTLAAGLALTGCGRDAPPTFRPNVLLVTLDTTRADHVGAYGAAPSPTPAFDRIAAEGVLFTRAWTVTPLTTPAHTSLMTGLYPQAHGVRNNGRHRMAESTATLAEAFASAGYNTAAFVASLTVGRAFGFASGFATFDDDFGDDARGNPRSDRTASEVTDRALPWLSRPTAEPFFAWVHYYDAHAPYEPPPPFSERFPDRPYDGEIAFADAQLDRVLDALRDAGTLDRTVVVIVGDHGEGLGDHGEPEHGLLLYEATVAIPLSIRAPWVHAPGGRRDDLVSLVDLAPTLAGLAGVPFPEAVDGRDLFRVASKPGSVDDPKASGPGRAVYAESLFAAEEFRWAPLKAVRRGNTKWIAAPRAERYDLGKDPGELENLAGRDVAIDAAMREALARVGAAEGRTDGANGIPVDEELLARLESLGYVGTGGAGEGGHGAPTSGRDPKDAIDDYNAYRRGTDMLLLGGDAVPLFERLTASDPGNPEFALRLGQAYRARGDLKAAERTYRKLIRRLPDFYLAYRRLAALLSAQGRNDEARDLWLALRARGRGFVGIDKRLAEAYLAAGDNEQALTTADAAAAAGGPDAELDVLAGRALERLGRDGEALSRYRAALAARASSTEALDGAVALLARLGRTAEIRPLIDDCVVRSGGNAAVRKRLESRSHAP